VRFLDDVVTANRYVPSIGQLKTAAHDGRRIGLGYMGLADLLMAIGCRYGARDGLEMTERVTRFMHFWAMHASIELAKERGPFRKIQGSIFDQSDLKWKPPVPQYTKDSEDGIYWDEIIKGLRAHGIRNAALTTLAPTGTIGTVAGVEGYGVVGILSF
jgi:ribonucleoside-diphosphate reductase alpha chain